MYLTPIFNSVYIYTSCLKPSAFYEYKKGYKSGYRIERSIFEMKLLEDAINKNDGIMY